MSNNDLAVLVAVATLICVCSSGLAYWSAQTTRQHVRALIAHGQQESLSRAEHTHELREFLRRLGK